MLHVLKLAYVLDTKVAPIPTDPIHEAVKTVNPSTISDLEKQRTLRRESEELCVGHNKNALSDRLYDIFVSVKDPRELWSALELKYKAHEEELFHVGVTITKLAPSWKDFSNRMMHKSKDYSLDDLMKYLRIKEETHIREKHVKVESSVYHVSVGGSGHKIKPGGQKKELGTQKTKLQQTKSSES
uniref:UBN2_2 domain-containing protein n=1 Tax=Lactuca sativa TaxID=4236 RepID=A0A9R1WTJ3_LACSA|nr:hypothetical protein LSAT_V11C100009720 [Lactuca sativa]